MTAEASLIEQIEALSRSEFRASVNATRRATLAIGALILHWGQFDSSLGSMIEWMREKHEAFGLGGLPEEHPRDHRGQLRLLRKLINGCSDDHVYLAEFDKLRERISRCTGIRDDLVHGAIGLGNKTGTDAGVYVFCAPYRKPRKKEGVILPGHLQLVTHPLSEIFEAADELYEDCRLLEKLVRAILAD
jgi:hypothetical protein